MTKSHSPGTVQAGEESLNGRLSTVLGHRVQSLNIEVHEGRLVLSGRTHSFYVKQLAQHAAMEVTKLPVAVNDIEVVSRPKRKVMLASGDDRVRTNGRDHLTAMGWDVVTATNGIECVAHLRRSLPNVAILDAGLLWGGVDGVLADITDGGFLDLPIIFLGTLPWSWNGRDAGQQIVVLDKPVDLDTLARAVASTVAGSWSQQW